MHNIKVETKSKHRVQYAADIANELINQINACDPKFKRIAISVTSYANVDSVKALLDQAAFKLTKNVSIAIYTTKGYLLQQSPFNFKHRYADNSRPWEYQQANTTVDQERLSAIEATRAWKRIEGTVSKSLFPAVKDDELSIVIMLNDVLISNLGELERNYPKVIMFLPGANESQHCWREMKEVEDKKWEMVTEKRPLEKRYSTKLKIYEVLIITGSELIKDLILTSYQKCRDPEPQLETMLGVKRDLKIELIASNHATKKRGGTLPIIVELLNKSTFEGKATLIGDGTYGLHSFCTLRSSIAMIDGPIILKVQHPSLEQIKSYEKQLDMEREEIKKAIVIDNVTSALRRINEGQAVHIICEPHILGWLRDIPEVGNTAPIRVDVDRRAFQRDYINIVSDEQRNPVAEVLNKSISAVTILSKSKVAFNKYVKKNGVKGSKLEKLIVGVLLTTTYLIRDRTENIMVDEQADKIAFKFERGVVPKVPDLGDSSYWLSQVEDGDYDKLLKLCNHVLKKYAEDSNTAKKIFWEYDRNLKWDESNYGGKK